MTVNLDKTKHSITNYSITMKKKNLIWLLLALVCSLSFASTPIVSHVITCETYFFVSDKRVCLKDRVGGGTKLFFEKRRWKEKKFVSLCS